MNYEQFTKEELRFLLESKKKEIVSIQQTLHEKYGVEVMVMVRNEYRTKRGENAKVQAIKVYRAGYNCDLREAVDNINLARQKPTPVRQEVVNQWIEMGLDIELIES